MPKRHHPVRPCPPPPGSPTCASRFCYCPMSRPRHASLEAIIRMQHFILRHHKCWAGDESVGRSVGQSVGRSVGRSTKTLVQMIAASIYSPTDRPAGSLRASPPDRYSALCTLAATPSPRKRRAYAPGRVPSPTPSAPRCRRPVSRPAPRKFYPRSTRQPRRARTRPTAETARAPPGSIAPNFVLQQKIAGKPNT